MGRFSTSQRASCPLGRLQGKIGPVTGGAVPLQPVSPVGSLNPIGLD